MGAMVLTAVGVSVTAQRQTSGMRRRRTVCASLDSMDLSANRPIAPTTAPWAVLVTQRRASVLVMILIAAQIAARRNAQVLRRARPALAMESARLVRASATRPSRGRLATCLPALTTAIKTGPALTAVHMQCWLDRKCVREE